MNNSVNTKNPTAISSSRVSKIQPFYVMEILARAKQLESEGASVIHLEVGEPDFPTAKPIVDAGIESLQAFKTHYTPACGLPQLRKSVAGFYKKRFALDISENRIVITSGASGAIQLALSVLTNINDEILLSDPGYPCNKNIAQLLGLNVKNIVVDATTDYQLQDSHINQHWQDTTRIAMVSSPSNPTGTVIPKQGMASLVSAVDSKQGYLIVDEIYQGLTYDIDDFTALSFSDNIIVINSFSKYFGMTGWRLGWMVVPEFLVDAVDRAAQNLFLAPPTMSQYAALAAFSAETSNILESRVATFKERRDYLFSALPELGFKLLAIPQGAFYIYAECSAVTDDAYRWTQELLETEGVALTPGLDFGEHNANTHIRFAYTRPIDELKEAVRRIKRFIHLKRLLQDTTTSKND